MALTRLNNRSISAVTELPSNLITGEDLPPGSILQAVYGSYSSFPATSDGSTWHNYQAITITPKSASSTILIQHVVSYGGVDNSYAAGRLIRDSSQVLRVGNALYAESHFTDASYGLQMNANANDQYKMWNTYFQITDTPNTTSQVSYQFQYRPDASNRQVDINYSQTNPSNGYNPPPWTSTTLLEIAG